jgi:large subunit ribosomal protein L21e
MGGFYYQKTIEKGGFLTASKGFRRKTRKLLRLRKGANPLKVTSILRNYKLNESVVVDINPSIHKGMPHRRYHGKVGVIVGKRGRAYILKMIDGSVDKTLIVRPEHLKTLIH